MTLHGFYTNAGQTLAAKIAAGTTGMTVTRVVAGDGHTTDIPTATDLPAQKQTLHIGLPSVIDSTATLPVTLLEAEAMNSYALTELGVYASDPDAGEILFQVYQLSESAQITALNTGVLRFYLRQTVGAGGVTVTCSPAGVLLEEDIAELRGEAAGGDHRNLLDNPWFTVNQRGKGTDGKPWSTGEYGVDRWKCMPSAATVNEVGISFKSREWAGGIVQYFETAFFEHLAGIPLTASVLDANGVLYTGTIPNYDPSHIGGYWIALGRNGTEYISVILEAGFAPNFGRIHFANDAAQNYAEELVKCERYCAVLRPSVYGFPYAAGVAWDASTVRVLFDLPTTMRTTPSLINEIEPSYITLKGNGISKQVSSISVYGYAKNKVLLHVTVDGGLTQYATYDLCLATQNGTFAFSPDL